MAKFSYLLFFIFLLTSCSLFKKDFYDEHPCISEKTKNIVIEWGYYITETNSIYGFKLDTKGQVYIFEKSDLEGKLLLTLPLNEFCDIYSSVNREILKTQTLSVPSDTNAFIMMKNPDLNYQFRAIWDPRFETVGSQGFRDIFKKLNKQLPADPNNKKIYHNFEFKD